MGTVSEDKKRTHALPDLNPKRKIHQPWTPSSDSALKMCLLSHLCAGLWSNLSDCDEVYNYWEPMHYLLYGDGFQTWEYSPIFAIRSYAYIWLYMLPLRAYSLLLKSNQVFMFYLMRCILAVICSLCEVYCYRAVCRHFGVNTGRLMLIFLISSSGMFISSTGFLPSTFSMYMTLLSFGGWLFCHYPVAIFFTAFSTFVGWPFAALIGLPIAFDMLLLKKKYFEFFKWSIISSAVILIPLVLIDSYHYGCLVIAPLNILMYNVFSDHGPNLYGTEPWHFYFVNSFLNFNFVFVLALFSLPTVLGIRFLLNQSSKGIPIWLALASMYLWIIVFFTQPHKEERFLFPIYPLFCFSAAICIDHIQKMWSYCFGSLLAHHYTESSNWIPMIMCLFYVPLSIARTYALYNNYHAPLDLYSELSKMDIASRGTHASAHINLCVGKEWYRYPSSFFLPDSRWKLQFIESEFRGQLPKPYSNAANATRVIPLQMNDQNLEEVSRYIDVSRCHYLIDLDTDENSQNEPSYSKDNMKWEIVSSMKFLDSQRSNQFFRAFHIPYFSEKYCKYINYHLLKSILSV